MKTKLQHFCILLALFAGIHQADAQGTTAFTYQGQLHDGGTNANGAYTMIFKLYDAVTSGNQIGSTITTSPTLANGLFTVNLDFGAGAFNGNARWLDITVTNSGTTQTLSPRVQVLADPYAQFAASANIAANSTNATSAISASSLNSGIWNASVFTNNGNTYLIFSANGSAVMGLTTNSVTVIAQQLGFANNGGSINGDGNDGLVVNNNLTVVHNLTIGPTNENPGTIYNDGQGNVCVSGLSSTTGAVNVNDTMNVKGSINITNGSGNLAINVTSGNFFDNGAVTAVEYYTSSDRNLKENFTSIDSQTVLDRVANLPISQWSFKQEANTRHIGPMAQDFYAAFNVGKDDKHIATVDEDGVALAAIQGLNEKLKAEGAQKNAQIKALEKRLSDLEQFVKAPVQK